MAKFRIDGSSIVDTDNASASWNEEKTFDGNNQISVNTGSQWLGQKLYRSRKGRYYVVHTSAYQGSVDRAEWVSPEEATRWLVLNEEALPEDLTEYLDQVTE